MSSNTHKYGAKIVSKEFIVYHICVCVYVQMCLKPMPIPKKKSLYIKKVYIFANSSS